MTYIWPLVNALSRVTQEYGANADPVLQPGGHTGMDFRGDIGNPILAEADGVIVFADWADALGWPNPYYIATSAIRPGGAGICVGLDVGPFQFWHAHLVRTDLNAGDHVKQGDIIGYMGNTGYAFGVHLHLDVLPDGWNVNSGDGRYGRVNPRDVIDGFPAVTPQGDAVLSNQRVTLDGGAQRRSAPDKNSQALGDRFGSDLILTFKGFVRSTDPYGDGNNVWFVGINGGYFWSGSFTDTGTHDLMDMTPPPPPVVVPPVVVPDPAQPPTVYDFPLAFPSVNGVQVEKKPAHIGNVEVGKFPADPDTAVCHWWNDLAHAPAFDSVIAEFQRAGSFKSAHFVVEDRIAQMVGLKDRAYHAGAGGNGWYGIEISPYAIERDAAGNYTDRAKRIQANVRALIILLDQRHGGVKVKLTLHKNVPGNNTSCSDLDLATFRDVPPVVVPPVPPVTPAFPSLDDTIRDLIEFYGN